MSGDILKQDRWNPSQDGEAQRRIEEQRRREEEQRRREENQRRQEDEAKKWRQT